MRQCLHRRRSPENFISWVVLGSWAGDHGDHEGCVSPKIPLRGAKEWGKHGGFMGISWDLMVIQWGLTLSYTLVIKHFMGSNGDSMGIDTILHSGNQTRLAGKSLVSLNVSPFWLGDFSAGHVWLRIGQPSVEKACTWLWVPVWDEFWKLTKACKAATCQVRFHSVALTDSAVLQPFRIFRRNYHTQVASGEERSRGTKHAFHKQKLLYWKHGQRWSPGCTGPTQLPWKLSCLKGTKSPGFALREVQERSVLTRVAL